MSRPPIAMRSAGLVVALAAGIASAATPAAAAEGFDQDPAGATPRGWTCGVTGSGAPVWAVAGDASAPSAPNVLRQSGSGTFPWCVMQQVNLADGFVETRFKSIAGKTDQAAGVVWRWKDANRYYVARANALEHNVSLYYVEQGRRLTLKYVDAPVPGDKWNGLRVEFAGSRIRVLLNGQVRIELDDTHIPGPGRVGVWTKADSVTAFDEFGYGELPRSK